MKLSSGRNQRNLLEVVAWGLDQLFELLFVVELAWRRQLLFIFHDVLGEGLARLAEEFTRAALDVISPLRLLHVLWTGHIIHQFRFEVSEVLPFLLVGGVADRDAVTSVLLGRSVELVNEGIFTLRAGQLSNSKAGPVEGPVHGDRSLLKIGTGS